MSDPYPSDSSPKGEAGSAAMSLGRNVEWSMVNGRSSFDALAEPVAADFDNSQFIM